jgi:hypothetical protein
MPQLNLKVPRALADDLTHVCELGLETLASLDRSLNTRDGCIVKPSDLRGAIAGIIGEDAVPVVERVLLGLSALRRQGRVSAAEIINSLTRAIDRLDWEPERRKLWEDSRTALENLLNNRSVIVPAKALDLLYDYEHFFVSAKILTDIRPVFDETKENIVGATVNQTLRLAYSDSNGESKTISITMDQEDVEFLRLSCEEGQKKSESARKKILAGWGVDTLTIDEVNNERS